MKILRCESIKKSFLFKNELSTVLEELDLAVEEGEFVSIVGTSGCGKTTLLELLAGITRPDSGEIYHYDEIITGKTGILGYMPQSDLLFPWLKAVDNVLLPCRIRGEDIKQARKKALSLLPVFGLENHADHLPWQLSGGLRQRVALARTYMTGSKVWLLDEPLANLDALTRESLQNWLHETVPKLGLSVILVTHDIDEAIHLSDRVKVMKQGRFEGNIDIPDNPDEALRIALKEKIRLLL